MVQTQNSMSVPDFHSELPPMKVGSRVLTFSPAVIGGTRFFLPTGISYNANVRAFHLRLFESNEPFCDEYIYLSDFPDTPGALSTAWECLVENLRLIKPRGTPGPKNVVGIKGVTAKVVRTTRSAGEYLIVRVSQPLPDNPKHSVGVLHAPVSTVTDRLLRRALKLAIGVRQHYEWLLERHGRVDEPVTVETVSIHFIPRRLPRSVSLDDLPRPKSRLN